MLNWRRDPAREMQIEQLKIEKEQLRNERKQIEKEIALLDITTAAGGDQLHFRRQLLAHGLAQLAGSADEQDFHANTSWGVFRDATDAGHGRVSRKWLREKCCALG